MPVRLFQSSAAAETERIGAELATELGAGDVVLVAGELGTGKTTLVRGACRALGIDGAVTSPTFTIGQRYRGRSPETPLVSHLDLYRVADLESEDPDLLEEYLRPDAIAFVEWPPESEAALVGLGRIALRVRLEHAGGDARTIRVEAA
jgi:tRNA threonylcarbamoyladenosine biosynthesis protein TsaE